MKDENELLPVLYVMAKHICCVQIKTIFILWIVVQLQMMFKQQGFTTLNQLTNSHRYLSTDSNFPNRKLFSASVNAQHNESGVTWWYMLFRTRIFQIAVTLSQIGWEQQSQHHRDSIIIRELWFACNWASLLIQWRDWSHHAFSGTQVEYSFSQCTLCTSPWNCSV